jgi:hypothetical protein
LMKYSTAKPNQTPLKQQKTVFSYFYKSTQHFWHQICVCVCVCVCVYVCVCPAHWSSNSLADTSWVFYNSISFRHCLPEDGSEIPQDLSSMSLCITLDTNHKPQVWPVLLILGYKL